MNGMHSSFYPKVVKEVMAQTIKESTLTVNRYYYGLVAFVMVMVCGAILVLPFLVEWLANYSEELTYMDSIVFIPFIGSFYLLKSVRLFFSAPYGILKFTKPLPVIYTVAVIIKIVGMLLLMQQFGIMGVITASLLSMSVEILLLYKAVKKHFNFRFNAYKIIGAPFLLLSLIITSEVLLPAEWQLMTHLAYCLICFGILLWAYRLEIKQLNPFNIIK
jgi:O-antigen/teichoic acid export membrane protein